MDVKNYQANVTVKKKSTTIFHCLYSRPPWHRVGQGGVVVYKYTRKKFAKIPQNTQNSSKYTQNYTQVYFIPEIQRK